MKRSKATTAVLLIVLMSVSVFPGWGQSANPQETLSVAGVWEVVSVSTQAWRDNIGKRLSITHRGDGYEVRWSDKPSGVIYTGNQTHIVHTELEELCDPTDSHGAGEAIPVAVRQKVAGQKVPINVSYILSADGRFLQRAQDGRFVNWNNEIIGNKLVQTYTHHEVKPGFYTMTLKRVQ